LFCARRYGFDVDDVFFNKFSYFRDVICALVLAASLLLLRTVWLICYLNVYWSGMVGLRQYSASSACCNLMSASTISAEPRLAVLSESLMPFMRYCGNNFWPNEPTSGLANGRRYDPSDLEIIQVTLGGRWIRKSSADGSYCRQWVRRFRYLWSCKLNNCAHWRNCDDA